MLRLYDNHLSGNVYKPRLLLAHLGRSYERIEVDILMGETRTPEFLARNPNGRIPVLEIEDGTCIAESNAILFYLSEDSRFFSRRSVTDQDQDGRSPVSSGMPASPGGGSSAEISPTSCCGRRSMRCDWPYSLKPLHRSVDCAFSVFRSVRPATAPSRRPRDESW